VRKVHKGFYVDIFRYTIVPIMAMVLLVALCAVHLNSFFGKAPERLSLAAGWEGGDVSNYTTQQLGSGTLVLDSYTPGEQTITLTAGSLYLFEAYGAQGGDSQTIYTGIWGGGGGEGSYARGYFAVGNQNQNISVSIGARGGNGSQNGAGSAGQGYAVGISTANGTSGGAGATYQNGATWGAASGGGGGGGASCISLVVENQSPTVLVVAGGGGGAGGSSANINNPAGRKAGTGGGGQTGYENVASYSGKAGTQSAHGAGGTYPGSSSGGAGTSSGGGKGGFLDNNYKELGGGGGGAGGGWARGYAGGGGAADGAGGGGSGGTSYIATVLQSASNNAKTINWDCSMGSGRITIREYPLISYSITYNLNGGAHVGDPITSYSLSSANPVELGTATRSGYTFNGWYENSTFAGLVVSNFNVTDRVDKTFWAKWTAVNYTVTYNLNGGNWDGAPPTTGYTVEGASPFVLPTNVTKAGYTFDGWYPNVDLSGQRVSQFNVTDAANKTFWAKYEPIAYRIEYEYNGGAPVGFAAPMYTVESTNPITLVSATRAGYRFDGWYTNAALTGAPVVSFSVIDMANKSFFAKWTANTLTINYASGGGTGLAPIAPIQSAYGQTVVAPANTYTYALHKFYAWRVSGANITVSPNDEILAQSLSPALAAGNAVVTLTADWLDEDSFSVTYNYNGGEPTRPMTEFFRESDAGATIILHPARKDGHTFDGWFESSGLDGESLTEFIVPNLPEDMENVSFFAGWTINTFTVSFDTDGGSAVENQIVDWSTPAARPGTDPTREGHTFDGWWADDGFENEYIFQTPVTANTEVFAKWRINTHTVTFWVDDEWWDGCVVDWGTAIPAPSPAPARDSYTFIGWFVDTECENEYDFETLVTEDFDLYAKFEIITFIVTFETNGGSTIDEIIVEWGGTIIRPEIDPTRDGHTFAGWYADGEFETLFNFENLVSADLKIYAKWTIRHFTVSFNANGGSAVDDQTVDWNARATEPPAPTRDEYNFGGWYTDSEFTNLYDFGALVTGNIALFAKWDVVVVPPTGGGDGGGGDGGLFTKGNIIMAGSIGGGTGGALLFLLALLKTLKRKKVKKLKDTAKVAVKDASDTLAKAIAQVTLSKQNPEDGVLRQNAMTLLAAASKKMAAAQGSVNEYKSKGKKGKTKGGEKGASPAR
jgi:uncharacterized repeat protein (TIGR02543 family)